MVTLIKLVSSIGNHGDGHPDNTRTPLIVWGPGVKAPSQTAPKLDHAQESKIFSDETGEESEENGSIFKDGLCELWNISQARIDIEQGDIAPLMSSLIGIPFPMNSVGVLPTKLLENRPVYISQAFKANALQILQQFLIKQEEKKRSSIAFQEFPRLSNHSAILSLIDTLIHEHKYTKADQLTLQFIQSILNGIRYYHTYDWLFLRSIITIGYLSWIVYALIHLNLDFKTKTTSASRHLINASSIAMNTNIINFCTILLSIGMVLVLLRQEAPFQYYVYVAFPIAFLHLAVKQQDTIAKGISFIRSNALFLLMYLVCLECLV